MALFMCLPFYRVDVLFENSVLIGKVLSISERNCLVPPTKKPAQVEVLNLANGHVGHSPDPWRKE